MVRNREDPSAIPITEVDVTIRGTSPLVLLPLGVFKGQRLTEDVDRVDEARKLYRRCDGRDGFPAGGIKRSVLEGVHGLDSDTRQAVSAGMHILGEDETNMVALDGKYRGEVFDFVFKKPQRVVKMTLPVLDEWEAVFRIQYAEETISRESIKAFLGEAGKKIGIGHRRPQQGTFEVKKIVSV